MTNLAGNKKKGIIYGLTSGITWGLYTVILYNILNLYVGSTGEIGTLDGTILIIMTALTISTCDCVFALMFECLYLVKTGQFKDFLKVLFSKNAFAILPAAIFSGYLAAVPYSIASSYSTPVAGTISAAFPAIGAIVAAIWFKEKVTKFKFFGIILVIVGTGVMYGLAGSSGVPLFVYGIAFIVAIGYALEGVFGYNMMRDDVSSTVVATLRRVFLILLYVSLLVILSIVIKDSSYVFNLIKSFDMSVSIPFFANLQGVKVAVWGLFIVGSVLSAAAYLSYFLSLEFAGVATAQVLNITYGLWIVIILMLPPFSQVPSIGTAIGVIIVFTGAAIVSKET